MKNSKIIFLSIIFLIFFLFTQKIEAQNEFEFNTPQLEIIDEGNKIIGSKRGKVLTKNNQVIIESDTFEYNKKQNILNGNGNIIYNDISKDLNIKADKVTYLRNKDEIHLFGNVEIRDLKKNIKIQAETIKYFGLSETMITEGLTNALIFDKYDFKSKNVFFSRNDMKLVSKEKTEIIENKTTKYEMDNFEFLINDEFIKANKLIITENYKLENNLGDKFFFNNGFFDLKNKKYSASDTKVNLKKNIFGNPKNDPRIAGVSSSSSNNITKINKAVFTSCSTDNSCIPWKIEASEITHNRDKKQLFYKNAFLKIYEMPIIYYPIFFHPDPTVERQSGFLKPELNNSSVLESSLYIPYFKVLSENKDFTLRSTIFDNNMQMINGEYREVNANSSIIADIGLTKNFKSTSQNKSNNLTHLFVNFSKDLELPNFETSDLKINLEKTSNDLYLKIFDANLSDTILRPSNKENLNSNINLFLENEKFNLSTGLNIYENLNQNNSDRYTFVLPYYDYNQNLNYEKLNGNISFNSNGENTLKDTNVLTTKFTNEIRYNSNDYISKNGFKNSFQVNFKNLNTIAKNNTSYKQSPQVSLLNIQEFSSSLPLYKEDNLYKNYLTPKISFRYSPSQMNNNSSVFRRIYSENIFDLNRLGLSDSYEEDASITLGINYKKENKEINNRYLDVNLATVIKNSNNNKMPISSTFDKKYSNIVGSIDYKLLNNLELSYDFSADNDLKNFKYNSIDSKFSINNFVTEFKFIEEIDELGTTNSLENITSYEISENNFIRFNTRRNRKINLTEFYDLIYEYQNDCLIAGIRYRKNYYNDREIKPTENLFFTISLIPLTTYEYKFDQ